MNVSTRVGMWTGADPGPVYGTETARGTLQALRRTIRRVFAFVCTRCFRAFPSKAAAKEHLPVHARSALTCAGRKDKTPSGLLEKEMRTRVDVTAPAGYLK